MLNKLLLITIKYKVNTLGSCSYAYFYKTVSDAPESPTFIENLITTIMNNLQVFIHNIHIRYEDSSMRDIPLACGICLQSISIETTNRFL